MRIGILGLAGAGKDTTALLLQQALKEKGYDFKIDRFAAPLKDAARKVFGSNFDDRDVKEVPVSVDPDHMLEVVFWMCDKLGFCDCEMAKASELFMEHLGLHTEMSPRTFQQKLGTEIVRSIRVTAWADRVALLKGNYIIPDCRFETELVATDANILVMRPETVPKPEHPSEHLAWDLTHKLGCVIPEVRGANIHRILNSGINLASLRSELDYIVMPYLDLTGVV